MQKYALHYRSTEKIQIFVLVTNNVIFLVKVLLKDLLFTVNPMTHDYD